MKGDKRMSEEVAVKLQNHTATTAQAPASDLVSTLFLVGLGALALARDTAKLTLEQMKARGLEVKQQSEATVSNLAQSLPLTPKSAQQSAVSLDQGITQLLHGLNIPTKRDIDELNARIDQLNERISQLQDGGTNKL